MSYLHEQHQRELDSALQNSLYSHPEFQTVIEDHLTELQLTVEGFKEVAVNEAYRFEYDYFALLRYKGIPYHLHWIVMRVNGFLSPFDGHCGIDRIYIPNETYIQQLMNMWLTRKGTIM